MLLEELRIIFGVKNEQNFLYHTESDHTIISIKSATDNSSPINSALRDKISYEFSEQLQHKLSNLQNQLRTSIQEVQSLTARLTSDFDDSDVNLFLHDLKEYEQFLLLTASFTSSLIESFTGSKIIEKKIIKYFEFMNGFVLDDFKSDYFNTIDQVLTNINILVQTFNSKMNMVKEKNSNNDEPNSKKINFKLDKFNLILFFNPTRLLRGLIFKKFFTNIKPNLTIENQLSKVSTLKCTRLLNNSFDTCECTDFYNQ